MGTESSKADGKAGEPMLETLPLSPSRGHERGSRVSRECMDDPILAAPTLRATPRKLFVDLPPEPEPDSHSVSIAELAEPPIRLPRQV